MHDGQVAGDYQPDRAEDDAADLEVVAPTDSETEARTASLGAGFKQPGTSDSSIRRFMDGWSDDDDDDDDHGADSHPAPQSDVPPAQPTRGTQKRSAKGPTGQGSKRAKPTPTGPVLEEAALEIPPIRFAMPSFAAHLPRAEG